MLQRRWPSFMESISPGNLLMREADLFEVPEMSNKSNTLILHPPASPEHVRQAGHHRHPASAHLCSVAPDYQWDRHGAE